MRKPRDFDSELKALADKAKQLKERRVRDLGALVTATGADALDADVLAGVLPDAAANTDKAIGEGWRKRGAAFFQGKSRGTASGASQQQEGTLPLDGGARLMRQRHEPTCANGRSNAANGPGSLSR